ncbi:hypothetical protein WAI453_011999 [Rhynchosporium graminicola]
MDSQEEILMNILADNPIVAIYNAEPTWQAGFLTVGIYLLKVMLGTVWIFIRILLLAIVWLINTLVAPYFPSMSLPEPENWPSAFMRGLSKLQNVPVITDSRFLIPLLVGLAILYIVLSLNITRCRQVLSRFQAEFAIKAFPGRRTVHFLPDQQPFVPGADSILVPSPWYHRIVSRFAFIVDLVSEINRRVIDFFTSQGLKKAIVAAVGLLLSYWAWHWLGDPVTILVEKNYVEWKDFSSAIRLNLYRAASWQFLTSAAYTIYVVYAYGFKTFCSVLGSMATLFVAYLAKAYAFMDTKSLEYQRAINVEPRTALSGNESTWMYFLGLCVVLPFVLILSLMASQAYEKTLLDPRGPIKKAFLALIMCIPNWIAGIMSVAKWYLSSQLTLIGSPRVASRRASDVASELSESSQSSAPAVKHRPQRASTPGLPPGPVSSISVSSNSSTDTSTGTDFSIPLAHTTTTGKTRHGIPAPITVPQGPVSPTLTSSRSSASSASSAQAVFQGALASFQEEVDTIKRSFNLRESKPAEFLKENWVMLIPLFFFLGSWLFPTIIQEFYHSAGQVFGLASYVTTFLGNTLESISTSIESALPALEPAVRIQPNGTFSSPIAPQVPISPSSPLLSSTPFTPGVLIPSTPSTIGCIWAALTGFLSTVTAFSEKYLGKATTNWALLAIVSNNLWFQGATKRWSSSNALSRLTVWFPLSFLIYQIWSYLREFEIFRKLVEDNYGYLLAFIGLALIRTYKTIVHGRASVPREIRHSTRPGKVEYKPSDVTVIIPTRGNYRSRTTTYDPTELEDNERDRFTDAVISILVNEPAEVILATTGLEAHKEMNILATRWGTHRVKVTSILESEANLRRQFLKATSAVQTDIVCYAHSKVHWSPTFLLDALSPFNNPDIGLVGVPVDLRRYSDYDRQYFNPKKYRRNVLKPPMDNKPQHPLANILRYSPFRIMDSIDYYFHDFGLMYGFLHYLEKNHYSRFNHSNHSTSSLDSGALSFVSAKTALIRTSILQSTSFRFTFPHEKIVWGLSPLRGGMRSDAAEFILRKVREMGYQTAFMNTPSTLVAYEFPSSSLSSYCRLISERYSSLYRSNLASLQTTIWFTNLWTAWAMFSALLNIPLVIDGGLAALLWHNGQQGFFWASILFLLSHRVYALYPHVKEHPNDWKYLPLGVAFYYLEGVFQVVGLFNAHNPQAEEEEKFVNVGYKGQYDENTRTVR